MKKYLPYGLGILILCFGVLGVINSATIMANKEIQKPIELIVLPEILKEISGLTDLGATTIACVQDEKGIVFIYDFEQRKITDKIKFADDGDYEGITRVNDKIFVLRSDGVLFEVPYKDKANLRVEKIETGIPAKNNDALCYDEDNNRLLIGSKVKSGKGSDNNERHIYGYNLKSRSIEKEPAYALNKSEIIKFAEKENIQLPKKKKKKTGVSTIDLKLGVSGISIHPKTKDLYVLCAVDYLFLIYNSNGKLKSVQLLDRKKYPQAEGITFYKTGELLISNEGQNGNATLMKFD